MTLSGFFRVCQVLLTTSFGFSPVIATAETATPLGTKDEIAVQGYNNEPINVYSDDADFVRLGRAVGLLEILTDKGPAPCTAFLISPTEVMTNWHCVPGILEHETLDPTRIIEVGLLLNYTEPGRPDAAVRLAVNPIPLETNESLDYSVLELMTPAPQSAEPLELSAAETSGGTPFWIIGHPLGKSQHISREGCRAADPPLNETGKRVRHTCDTLGGNSGSPILNASTRQVIGIHNSGNSRIGINFGIPMGRILEQSERLSAAQPVSPLPKMPLAKAWPRVVGVGDELSFSVEVPSGCHPIFANFAPSGKVTPIPEPFFDRIEMDDAALRYEISSTGRYGLVVQESDEKGQNTIGVACLSTPPETAEGQRRILSAAFAEVSAGRRKGLLPISDQDVTFFFTNYEIK